MYNYFIGEVADISGGNVVMDVNGIGYEFATSNYTRGECVVGQRTKLFAYLQVKEDGVTLFGFATNEEKNMFLRLISVSGIGGKVALAILSGMDSDSLAKAIFSGDTKSLTKIKGLGKKTAERLVLELREKVVIDAGAADLPIVNNLDIPMTKEVQNAVALLVSLGKSQNDAEKLIEAASKLGATTTEELVNMAFRID